RELDAARLALEAHGVPVDLAGVEHGVAALADVHEGRLHGGQHVLDAAHVDVADHRGLRLLGDVVLDEHVVLEHGDLGAASPLAHHHGALDGLAAGEELGLGDHGAAATGVTALAAALALGLEAGRALDGLDLVARLAHLDYGVRRIIGRGALIGAAAGAATTAASPRARGAAGRGAVGVLGVVRGAVEVLALRGVVRVLRVARVLVGLVLAGAVLGVLLVLAATAAATAPATAATAPTGAAALLGVVGGGVPLGAVIRGVVGLGAGLRVAALVRPGRRATDRKSTRLNSSHLKNSYAVIC